MQKMSEPPKCRRCLKLKKMCDKNISNGTRKCQKSDYGKLQNRWYPTANVQRWKTVKMTKKL